MTDPRAAATHDLAEFKELLLRAAANQLQPASGLFTTGRLAHIARAPGRLDAMGGIADYSGSLVLQWPIREATLAAAQVTDGQTLSIVSLGTVPGEPDRCLNLDRSLLENWQREGYHAARAYFAHDPSQHWASYVAGALLALAKERHLPALPGLSILIQSHVPQGKGVSSSAALEVAVLLAAASALEVPHFGGAEAARLGQLAENYVVGAPCGIMDQMTSALGQANHLLSLCCQPAEVRGHLRLPASIGLWGIDSGIRHAVTGSDYSAVRAGAFIGYRMIAESAGLVPRPTKPPAPADFEDPRWRGYLANLTPELFEREFAARLPVSITGADFLDRFGSTTDPVTHIDPDLTYAVRQPTAHPIHEHHRVRRFGEWLACDPHEEQLRLMGRLMYASHDSYSACGLGSDGTDRLVDMVRQAAPETALYGAKITGGGSGGTVAILARADAGPAIADIARRYSQETGRTAYLFEGSSPGASHTGVSQVPL